MTVGNVGGTPPFPDSPIGNEAERIRRLQEYRLYVESIVPKLQEDLYREECPNLPINTPIPPETEKKLDEMMQALASGDVDKLKKIVSSLPYGSAVKDDLNGAIAKLEKLKL